MVSFPLLMIKLKVLAPLSWKRKLPTPSPLRRHPHQPIGQGVDGKGDKKEDNTNAKEDIVVQTALGNFAATAHGWKPQAGQEVVLSVRPEALRLDTKAGAINSIPGSIRERVYLGEMAQYRFAAGDRTLKIFELNPRFAFGNDQSALFASADPADVIVLPE